jgi:hypothetical protein
VHVSGLARGGHTLKTHSTIVNIFVASFLIGIAIAIAWLVFKARANRRDEVLMDWKGLRVTPTELIVGYFQNSPRHSLKGLTARVEDTGFHRGGANQHRVHVIVEGPDTAFVKSVPAKSRYTDQQAREFVANLNMRSRQLN